MTIAIIDYGMGNLKSVKKAFAAIGFEAEITADPERVLKADKVVLPGVGAFRDAIEELHRTGLAQATREVVQRGTPVLGICLGMQLLFEKSYEYGEHAGLGLLPGRIIKMTTEEMKDEKGESLKIPHMGWNNLELIKKTPLFTGLEQGSSVYFVHSYYLETEEDVVSAYTTYGKRIAVAAQRDNLFATQFHPEKSGSIGLSILKHFGGMK